MVSSVVTGRLVRYGSWLGIGHLSMASSPFLVVWRVHAGLLVATSHDDVAVRATWEVLAEVDGGIVVIDQEQPFLALVRKPTERFVDGPSRRGIPGDVLEARLQGLWHAGVDIRNLIEPMFIIVSNVRCEMVDDGSH